MARAVGIDLGTTNSVVSVLEAGEPVVIPNAEGSRTTPSVVGFAKNGEILVGEVAKRQAITNPDRTVRSVKRHMGAKDWGPDVDGKKWTPQEISAQILGKLKRDAEAYLGDSVNQAVVTVPAYFDDSQRTATKEAGQIAGLEVLRIINEPTAAALAYGLDKQHDQTILVFDLGGGTFDVSLLEIGEGVFEVKATHGDTQLGGDDWDQRVIDWMVKEFKNNYGIDLGADRMALQRLKEAAEKAKIELSQVSEATINLPFVSAGAEGPLHLEMKLSRSEFERLTEDLVQRTREPFELAVKDWGKSVDAIDHIILVGGSTRMPMIQELVKELTGGKEPHKGVNPDEVVAVGAAIQAGVLKGDVKDILLLDVTPLTLGVETKGGIFTRLIERNTTIPTRKSETFTTADDNQTNVEIHVLQGEAETVYSPGVRSLGKFMLTGLPPAPRGMPQIEVAFDIDANGIVNVSAKDTATGKEQAMTITGGTALSKEDIDRMVHDAEKFAAEDHSRREAAEARNQGDQLAYQVDRSLEEWGDKVQEADREELKKLNDELKEVLKSEDVEKIKAGTDAVMQTFQRIGQAMYQQTPEGQQTAAAAGGGGSAATEPEGENDVVEGEIVDEGVRDDRADEDPGQGRPDEGGQVTEHDDELNERRPKVHVVDKRRYREGEPAEQAPPARAAETAGGASRPPRSKGRRRRDGRVGRARAGSGAGGRVPRPPAAAPGGVRELPQADDEVAGAPGRCGAPAVRPGTARGPGRVRPGVDRGRASSGLRRVPQGRRARVREAGRNPSSRGPGADRGRGQDLRPQRARGHDADRRGRGRPARRGDLPAGLQAARLRDPPRERSRRTRLREGERP